MPGVTPSQTVGPFFHDALLAEDQTRLVDEEYPGAIRLHGTVYDGAGEPVPDAMVEIWQADSRGRYPHSDAPLKASEDSESFTGFGRSGTDWEGRFGFVTVKPGRVPGPKGTDQAPHVLMTVFARGLLKRVVTRIYFPDEEASNAADPVLLTVQEDLRYTLVAEPGAGGLRFDVRLQDGPGGEPETVFFSV
ncbi:protocatechuate 3,4-dioxygenase subunit alpha [Rubrobacter aplysinae]|uniref:protocatechuate 3,4-dioxygenase subunit alpha n=1 Tax=Rubrobacter aplysinae TaxID=909625 RepID=UPI00064B8D4E|nr:protocatechuate 3,4-dioxygenase subunit alpha [Rubrobacter aplysinae]